MKNANVQQIVTATANASSGLSPRQLRQWDIMNSDYISRWTSGEFGKHNETEFIDGLNKLYDMKVGKIPFEEIEQYKKIELPEESSNATTYQVFWTAKRTKMRSAGLCLFENLKLIHVPHTMSYDKDGERSADTVRFSTKHVTKNEANAIYNANKNVFESMQIIEPVKKEKPEGRTLPKRARLGSRTAMTETKSILDEMTKIEEKNINSSEEALPIDILNVEQEEQVLISEEKEQILTDEFVDSIAVEI